LGFLQQRGGNSRGVSCTHQQGEGQRAMIYTIKLSEEELYAVINSLSGTLGNIQRQAAEQQQAARQPKEQETEPD